jgi:transposase InsO family protein
VIKHTSSIFARHGIPEIVVSDNGPQYSADLYATLAKNYGFEHVTSSPHYPQGNGEAERAIKTIKGLLRKSGDPYLSLLAYRSTPLEMGTALHSC